jgi:polar amino acid transport system substrate-binding protein
MGKGIRRCGTLACLMRKLAALALPVAALSLLAAGLAQGRQAAPALTGACAKGNLTLVSKGELTVGTDNPAYPPWFGGKEKSPWKVSDPRSGKGYESAVAYAVASVLGFSKAEVKWVYVPFLKSFAPGKKNFDFDINQISYGPLRAKSATFSASYYEVKQAIVVKNGTAIAKAKSIAGLRKFTLGAQLGTTSYAFIVSHIKPSKTPKVYSSNAAAVEALKIGRIDGLVVDLPTALYVAAAQVPNSTVLGQFETTTGEHFGMVLQKGNPLVSCLNKAIAVTRGNGTLKRLERTWITNTGVPVLK